MDDRLFLANLRACMYLAKAIRCLWGRGYTGLVDQLVDFLDTMLTLLVKECEGDE